MQEYGCNLPYLATTSAFRFNETAEASRLWIIPH